MMQCHLSPLPKPQLDRLRSWLSKPEALTLRECVAAQIAELQVESANAPLSKPMASIMVGRPALELAPMAEAARLKIFLDVLDELSGENSEFNTAKITV